MLELEASPLANKKLTTQAKAKTPTIVAHHLKLIGVVQGVGLRPHLYKLAYQFNLSGWVKNTGNYVELFIQGNEKDIQPFLMNIYAMPLANIENIVDEIVDPDTNITMFSILKSKDEPSLTFAIKDYAICEHCKEELLTENSPRYLYPFTSCTNCGPRYSIIKKYPLDRENSSFNAFTPCHRCNQEYSDSNNRRFHAQNICCEQCGPELFSGNFTENFTENQNTKKHHTEILKQAIKLLNQGKIIALKSSSGYKLICDATNSEAIETLRIKKNRPHKPFAIMFPNSDSLRELTYASKHDIQFLKQKENPILIVDAKPNALPSSINPHLTQIATCLPGAAIETLIQNKFNKPLIFTSGNIGGQPIITNHIQAEEKLGGIADYFVHHNLEIIHAMDDSVWRQINNKKRPLRLGKGYAPIELSLPATLAHPVIALGAQTKNTIAIAWRNRIVISPHIGDTGDYDTWTNATLLIDSLKERYGINPTHYLIDTHNGYTSHQWVKQNNFLHTPILHHHAHASAIAGFMPTNEKSLIFTWDGTGLGENGQLWGGETFIGTPGNWQRIVSFKKFALPGAETATKQPWRTGASLLWHCNLSYEQDIDEIEAIHKIWKNNTNTPLTSSVGRLFDAAAAILGLLTHASYDGQAAMMLESNADNNTSDFISITLVKNENHLYIADWKSLIHFLANNKFSVNYRATVFHNSLAHLILDQCLIFRRTHNINNIGLSGGVFQNDLLATLTAKLLKQNNFNCYINDSLPSNDAQISYGQVIEFLARANNIE